MCDVSTCFYRSWSRIGGCLRLDPDTDGRFWLYYIWGAVGIPDHDSWLGPVVWYEGHPWLYVCAIPTLRLAPWCCEWTQREREREYPVIKPCAPAPVGLSRFRCSLNLFLKGHLDSGSSHWQPPMRDQDLEKQIETSHMFQQICSKVSKLTINFDSWSHEQYISYYLHCFQFPLLSYSHIFLWNTYHNRPFKWAPSF